MSNIEKHLRFNGFEVWVSVEGRALTQYGEDYDESKNEVTCWIPSETNKKFSVNYQKVSVDRLGDNAKVTTFVDGSNINSWVLAGRAMYNKCTRSTVKDSGNVRRCLTFGTIELTDDDNYLDTSSQDVGEIKVVVHKVKVKSSEMKLSDISRPSGSLQLAKVHERSKKGHVHQIKYGDAVAPSMRVPYMHYKTKDYGTIATFIFRYRPLALLQANGVAPLTPAVPVDQAKVKVPDNARHMDIKIQMSDDEDDEIPEIILEKERTLIAELEQVRLAKRAARSKDKRPKKRVKSEMAHFIPGEIIDLTI
ncbi:hypothetical protein HYPSUDRAFT_91526 [Hypholoma sublateritium FD-334 SS-4]|uniref:DUF7918 domain-containing protein n=1 Tax=Hypholoma sublateritium (strain FD-334 SS-4) TaxID=945553 RepID=A0A0D2KNA1_HYPSF|nr:hypothetical protein HYPSUDRAFT_91526 [Hypholoma sublateritium FD-334 SS-4]